MLTQCIIAYSKLSFASLCMCSVLNCFHVLETDSVGEVGAGMGGRGGVW